MRCFASLGGKDKAAPISGLRSLHRSIQIQPRSVVYKRIRLGLVTDYWSVIDRNLRLTLLTHFMPIEMRLPGRRP